MSDWSLAFPLAVKYASGEIETHNGLTKRELFAAMAMQGIMAAGHETLEARDIALIAVAQADNLIAELEKQK